MQTFGIVRMDPEQIKGMKLSGIVILIKEAGLLNSPYEFKGGYTYVVFRKDQKLYRFIQLFAEWQARRYTYVACATHLFVLTFVHFDVWKIPTFFWGMTNTEPNLLSLKHALR